MCTIGIKNYFIIKTTVNNHSYRNYLACIKKNHLNDIHVKTKRNVLNYEYLYTIQQICKYYKTLKLQKNSRDINLYMKICGSEQIFYKEKMYYGDNTILLVFCAWRNSKKYITRKVGYRVFLCLTFKKNHLFPFYFPQIFSQLSLVVLSSIAIYFSRRNTVRCLKQKKLEMKLASFLPLHIDQICAKTGFQMSNYHISLVLKIFHELY